MSNIMLLKPKECTIILTRTCVIHSPVCLSALLPHCIFFAGVDYSSGALKLQKESQKAKKKEKKRERKEREKTNEKKLVNSQHEENHIKRKREEKKLDQNLFSQKTSNDVIQQLERSGITEEHELPCSIQYSHDSPESSQDSNKRRKLLPSDSGHNKHGIIIRIKLPTLKQRDSKPPLLSVRQEDAQLPLASLKKREPKPLLPSVRQEDAQLPLPSLKQRELKPRLPSVRQADAQLPLPLLKQREPKPPLPSLRQADTKLPLPSLKQRELKPPLPSLRQADTKQPLLSLEQREPKPPLPSLRQADTKLPLPSLEHREPKPPLPLVRQADTKLPLPSLTKRESKPPLPSLRQADARLPVPSLKQREPKPPLPSVRQADAQVPFPSLKQRGPEPRDTRTAAQVNVVVNNKSKQIADERPAVDEQPCFSGRAVETGLDREAAAPLHRTTSSKRIGSRTRQQEKFDELIVNWNPSPLQLELESSDAGGDDWLFGAPKQRGASSFAAESKSSNGSGSNAISSPQPRARYLPEFDMYQLPYTVPF
ncbi:uncharacterized protein LOC135612742 isoform X1 [Musa acuminata AAA Group]|uniref:uncharacterized protein LOC135612742 isoform X1 n=1 Tax=Musa acuminata AAA Group TaxID=214697 RepID=UPI0031D67949